MKKRALYALGAIVLAFVALAAVAWRTAPVQAAAPQSLEGAASPIAQDAPVEPAHGPGHGGDDEPDNTIRFVGVVEVMPTGGLTGTWQISGETFLADDDTEFDTEYGNLEVGACVKVVSLTDTPTIAEKIKVKPDEYCQTDDDDDDDEDIRVYGLIEAMPSEGLTGTWTISGTVYTATTDTEFSTWYGGFDVGVCVLVETRSSTPDIAEKISSRPMYKCKREPGDYWIRGVLFGEIVTLPDTDDLTGTWVVGSVAFSVTAETKLNDHKAPFEPGVFVKVRFYETDGVKVALEVKSKHRRENDGHDDDGNGCYNGKEGQAFGPIVTVPDGLMGTWDVAGVAYLVDDKTKLDDDTDYIPGLNVLVKYYTNDEGKRIALRIKATHDYGGGDGSSIFSFVGWVEEKPDGFIGVWTIGGESFTTTDATEFREEHGLLTETAYVRAKYRIEGDTRIVLKLETEVPPDGGDDDYAGVIENIQQDGASAAAVEGVDVSGTWRIGGQEFVVTPATNLNDLEAALQVGNLALVNSYVTADGTRVATHIRAFNIVGQVMVPIARH